MASRNNTADSTTGTSCENEEGNEVTDSPVNLNNSNLSAPAYATQERIAGRSSEMVGPGGHRSALTECPEPIQCIWKTSIGEAPHAVHLKTKLKILLDPPRPLGGDIKSLADAFGYTGIQIHYLTTIRDQSATEELLSAEGHHSIEHLLDKLDSINREDAAGEIRKYIRLQKCKCEGCKNELC